MLSALGDALPLATGLALSPFAIVTGIVLLLGERGRVKAAALGFGWFLAILVIAAIALAVVEVADDLDHDATETGVDVVQLIIAVLFLVLAGISWRKRPARDEPAPKNKLLERLDGIGTFGALGMGLAQGFIVVKNIPLALGAGARLGEAGLQGASAITALIIFALVASAGIIIPLAISIVGGQRIAQSLINARAWFEDNMSPITITVLVIIGVYFLGQSLGMFN